MVDTSANSLQAILSDPARLDKLRELHSIDPSSEAAFDRLTQIASDVLKAPVSLVSLVEADRQFFVSQVGLPEPWSTERQTPLSHSFCQHLVASSEPLIVEDARTHPDLKDNLAIQDLQVIAYLGIPLITSDQHTLGSFCVIDSQPRQWSQDEVRILTGLSAAVIAEIELRSELLAHKETMAQLQESQQKFQRIMDHSTDMIGTATFDGHFIQVNAAFERTLGYPAETMMAQPYIDFVHPEDVEATVAEATKITQEGVATTFVNRYRNVDGSYRWLSWKSVPDLSHQLIHFVARDITEEREAREAVERNQRHYRQILHAIDDFVLLKGPNSRILWANQAFQDYYGMSNDKLRGIIEPDFVPDHYSQQYMRDDEVVFTTGQRLNIPEEPIQRHDGEVRLFHTVKTPLFDGDGNVVMSVGISRDITERQKLAKTLADTEEQFRTAFEQAAVGIAHVGTDGAWLRVNQTLCDIVGYTHAELMGMTFQEITHPSDLDADLDYVQQMLRGDIQTYAMHKRYIRKDQSEIWVKLTVSLVRNEDNSPKYFVSVVEDVSEQMRLEAALQESLAHQYELNQMRVRLSSMIAHEFRTPLTVIQTSGDLLGGYLDRMSEEKRSLHLGNITQQVRKLVNMLDDMLLLNKAESLALEKSLTSTNFEQLCIEIVDEYLWLDTDHDVVIITEQTDCNILVDVKLLRQAISNLISNAIKYSPEGGRVEVRIECTDTHAIIRVSDQGIGIPKEDQAHLFTTFHRASNTTSIAGTGIGLSIVKRAVDAHDGTISLESQLGHGTTFTIKLPKEIETVS